MKQYFEDLLIDALLDRGFSVQESRQLIHIQEQREQQMSTNHQRFIRWLVEKGRLSDWNLKQKTF